MRLSSLVLSATLGVLGARSAQAVPVFDPTSKIGAIAWDRGAAEFRKVCGFLQGAPTKIACGESSDGGVNWTWTNPYDLAGVNHRPYPHSGIYFQSDHGNIAGGEAYFFLVSLDVATDRDVIDRFYVDGQIVYKLQCEVPEATRLGPRLAVTTDTPPMGAPNAWVFAVANRDSAFDAGDLHAFRYPGYGANSCNLVENLSGFLVFQTFDADDSPIAATKGTLYNQPVVAMRSDRHTLGVVYMDGGGNWNAIDAPLLAPLGVEIGNSTAAISPPRVQIGGGWCYDWFIVPGSDGHLYETCLYTNPNISQIPWLDYLRPMAGTGIDSTSDSIAASWYLNLGNNHVYQNIFARSTGEGGNQIPFRLQIDNTNGIAGPWTPMDSGPGWPGLNTNFLGMDVVWGPPQGLSRDELFGWCQAPVQMCQAWAPGNSNNFEWHLAP